MNLQTFLNDCARYFHLARQAREDAERAEAFAAIDPDATVRIVHQTAPREKDKN
jgi:hypothetical protein